MYIHRCGINEQTKALFSFNLDKDRLEAEMRTFYIARLIDKAEKTDEKENHLEVAKLYGPKMTHKFELMQKDKADYVKADKFEVSILP